MFTGLVEEVGTIHKLRRKGDYQLLTVNAKDILDDMKIGDSIAINGVCQTVTHIDSSSFSVETLAVSLKKTTLGLSKKGDKVNLERALTLSNRLGGHIVQGHVDGVGRISTMHHRADNIFLEIILPHDLIRFCVAEGSIAVDGISLTIAELRGIKITINIIPKTWENTILTYCRTGDQVNIEIDIMARYVERMLKEATSLMKKGIQYEKR